MCAIHKQAQTFARNNYSSICMWGHSTVIRLAWLTMLAVSTVTPAGNDTRAQQTSPREDLAKLTSEMKRITEGTTIFGDSLTQYAAKIKAAEDLTDQTNEMKELGREMKQQGEELKAQGQNLKAQGREVKKLANDLKIHGTQLKDLVAVIDDLSIAFRSLREGIVRNLENQDKKIEWSITDGSLSPRNVSWVEENFRALRKKHNWLEAQMGRMMILVRGIVADCSEATISGVYTIAKVGLEVSAYCQVDETGKWTVIQKREDGSVNFFRNWRDYSQGFGDLAGEYWLGNKNIHSLTAAGLTKLRIDLEDWENHSHTIYYNMFSLAGIEDQYRLTVSGFVGSTPPGDELSYHNGMKFSTYDRDNDLWAKNCASDNNKGAWWYKNCHYSDLNGEYNNTVRGKGINWYPWRPYEYSLKKVSMMISIP